MDTLKFSKENIGLILIFILLIIAGLHFYNMREKFNTTGLTHSMLINKSKKWHKVAWTNKIKIKITVLLKKIQLLRK